MFVYNSSTSLFWFNGHCTDCAAEYSLIGMLFGLAIYNNIIVDVQFPLVLHKKLMNKLGTMDDLKDLDPVSEARRIVSFSYIICSEKLLFILCLDAI